MNRKETRQMSKNLGILQHQKKLSFNKKMELLRANITEGKSNETKMRESVELYKQQHAEETESNVIYSLAEQIGQDKDLSVVDAMPLAKQVYNNMMNK